MVATTVLATAAVLGLTHGIEPDHAAGIASLTSETGGSKRSALVGGCFAAGHVLLVIVWIGVAYVLLGVTSFPGTIERFGTVVLGLALVLLSGVLGISGVRTFVHSHRHDHNGLANGDPERHRHLHFHRPFAGYDGESSGPDHPHDQRQGHDHDRDRGHDDDHDHDHEYGSTSHSPGRGHDHDHTALAYLKVGVVGALFTLSPPLSMLAFVSVVVGNVGVGVAVAAIAVYAAAIVPTMAAVGSGVGAVFSVARKRGEQVHAFLQVGSAAIVFALGSYFLWQVLPSSLL
jgi:ABC-type nickel/cobalt efflux system permease component RcnA